LNTKFHHFVNGALSTSGAPAVWGVVSAVESGVAQISGLSDAAKVGDRVKIDGATPSFAEIVAMREQVVLAMPDASLTGLAPGDRAFLCTDEEFKPSEEWLGGVLNSNGDFVDGGVTPRGDREMSLHASEAPITQRRGLGERLNTSLAPFDTFLPICRGQRIGLFAGSGVGKTTLVGDLAKGVDADVVIVALIGERSREVRDFVDDILKSKGRDRSIVFASTCDEPAPSKRRCAHMAVSTAEYFRDQGLHVLLLFDSLTRFADAHREIALTAGETPSLRAYPPSTFRAIAALAERTGPGVGVAGDITAVFSVLVAGSDMDEPVADMVRSILDGHVVLERSIAERGRFPAVDIRRSVSRSLPKAARPDENILLGKARRLIAAYDDAAAMIQTGLYASGSDSVIDEAIRVWPQLDAFVSATSASCEESFQKLKEALSELDAEAHASEL
jgi:flagellum-specific ATP synthase